ncbi:MAG: hypothetical protein AAGA88_03440 [Pseudomonadota bacterium]
MAGYTKEKSEKIRQDHIDQAERLERQAKDQRDVNTFDDSQAEELERQAREHRQKAENQEELQKHWGDR